MAQWCGSNGGGGNSGSGFGIRPWRGPTLTLYTPPGFTKVLISGASPLLRLLLFLLPSAVKGKSKLWLIPETLFNLTVSTYSPQTFVLYIWKHTHTQAHLFASTHMLCIHHSTSHHVILQCRSFFLPTPLLYSQAAFLFFTASLFKSLLSITIHQQTYVCHKLEGLKLHYNHLHIEQGSKRVIVHHI